MKLLRAFGVVGRSRCFGVLAGVFAWAMGCSPTTSADAGPDAASPDASATDASDVAPSTACMRMPGRPDTFVQPTYAGPTAPIELVRDTLGIVHVYARTDEDVSFGSGYAQAVDRLFQMDLMRRTAYGTLAEVIGREKLAQDQLIRLMDIPRWGRASIDRLARDEPTVHRLIVAWTAGVNRRIEEVRSGRAPLPAGFRATEFNYMPTPWTPDDPVTISRLLLFRNANQLNYDLLASVIEQYATGAATLPLFQSWSDTFVVPAEERPRGPMGAPWPPSIFGQPLLVPGAGIGAAARAVATAGQWARHHALLSVFRSGGSNNWAVAGRFTDNGRPRIAGDPHQPLQSPAVFWAHHMDSASAGGTFDVIGFSFVGTPGIHLGHNRNVVWTATTSYPDTMDTFDVPAGNGFIRLGARTLPVQRCIERIAIRGESAVEHVVEDVSGVGVLLPRNITPVPVTRSSSDRLLFRWAGFRATSEATVFFGFDRARNVADFDAAVDHMDTGAFNFIAADARDITYRVHVLVPDRGEPRTMPAPFRVVDGSSDRGLWRDDAWLPSVQLPHSRGGMRGFLSSANNDPFGFTSNGRVDDDPWYYGVWFDPGTRARRIDQELQRLTARGGLTHADFQTLQLDVRSEVAEATLPTLLDAWSRVETDSALAPYRGDAALAGLVEMLRAWDRRATRDSSAAVAFEAWIHFLARDVLADELEIAFDPVISEEPVYMLNYLVHALRGRFAGSARFLQSPVQVHAMRALAQTRDWLTLRFGGAEPRRYRWSDFHRTRVSPVFANAGPFDGGLLQNDGTIGTVNVSQAQFFGGSTPRMFHEARSGAVYRMTAGFAADGVPEAEVIFVRGNSGDPASPYFANLADDWVAGHYRPLPFRRADVDAQTRERTMIAP